MLRARNVEGDRFLLDKCLFNEWKESYLVCKFTTVYIEAYFRLYSFWGKQCTWWERSKTEQRLMKHVLKTYLRFWRECFKISCKSFETCFMSLYFVIICTVHIKEKLNYCSSLQMSIEDLTFRNGKSQKQSRHY